ncbi:hypothetical protein ACRRTK_015215 [Alexandromys fortis]
MKSPRLSPEGPMGGQRRRGADAEWTGWRGTSEGVLRRVCRLLRRPAQPWVRSISPKTCHYWSGFQSVGGIVKLYWR